jgi:chorismate mutase
MNLPDEVLRLRSDIDLLDEQILSLLSKRLDLARGLARAKDTRGLAICDPSREEEVLRRARDFFAGDTLAQAGGERVFTEIMALSRACQKRECPSMRKSGEIE